MLNPIVVPTALLWPHSCSQCQSQTGPLVDTHHENRVGDRLYLCASCVRLDALALGYLEGDEHTKLLNVAEQESETAKQLAQMTEKRDKLAAELKIAKKAVVTLHDDLDWHRGRVDQLERAITEDARSRLAIVGDDAA
jgi:cell division protein FtsB